MGFLDRLLTIVVTATITSAAWIVVGGGVLDRGDTFTKPAAQKDSETVAAAPQPASAAVVEVPEAEDMNSLTVPVSGVSVAQLSDTFTDQRSDGTRLHEALDIMAPAGTAVVAAGPGTVERLFRSDAGGNTLYVRSEDRRTIHYYAHLRDYAVGLKEGQQVRRGQRLGSVGSSGNASPNAPHLHFAVLRTTPDAEWWEPATALNPYPLLRELN